MQKFLAEVMHPLPSLRVVVSVSLTVFLWLTSSRAQTSYNYTTGQTATGTLTLSTNDSATFMGSGSAGSAQIGLTASGASVYFTESSTASAASLSLVSGSSLFFMDFATAGAANIANEGVVVANGNASLGDASFSGQGYLFLSGAASAGSAHIVFDGSANGSLLRFSDSASADSATITVVSGATQFMNSSTAGSAVITSNGSLQFYNTSSAGTATITTQSGGVQFWNNSTADTATITTHTGSSVSITNTSSISGVSIGSLAGGGDVVLGDKRLTVGGLNASTTIGGIIDGAGGSLVKTGTGTLTLTGVNTYTGGTTINGGTLLANGQTNDPVTGRPYSSTGSGAVTVATGGALGGSGYIDGLVTVQNGATLTFGSAGGFLTLTGGLTLQSGSILDYQLGAVNDILVVDNGVLTSTSGTGGVTINLSSAAGFAPATYTLITFYSDGGATTSGLDLSDFTLGSTIAGYDYTLALTAHTLQLTATASAVPEPSTYAALVGFCSLALVTLKRRRRS